jgi:hypothetical protein
LIRRQRVNVPRQIAQPFFRPYTAAGFRELRRTAPAFILELLRDPRMDPAPPHIKEISMNASRHNGGSRAPGLLIGGMVAGAIGLALSAGNPSAAASATKDEGPAAGAYGQYGMPTSDTGLGSSATGGSSHRSSAGTGNPSSSGQYGSGMEGSASLPPNVASGWKIRVCSEKTKADQINFRFSMADKAKSGAKGTAGAEGTGYGGSSNPAKDSSVNAALSDQTISWTRGEATEIKAPNDLRDADRIRLEATPSQKDKKSSICVLYNDHVAKKLNFDDREVSTIKSTDNGECGC